MSDYMLGDSRGTGLIAGHARASLGRWSGAGVVHAWELFVETVGPLGRPTPWWLRDSVKVRCGTMSLPLRTFAFHLQVHEPVTCKNCLKRSCR